MEIEGYSHQFKSEVFNHVPGMTTKDVAVQTPDGQKMIVQQPAVDSTDKPFVDYRAYNAPDLINNGEVTPIKIAALGFDYINAAETAQSIEYIVEQGTGKTLQDIAKESTSQNPE